MFNNVGLSNVHTNPYSALENPQDSDKINTRQTTDNLANHARTAVTPQSVCDRAPLNAIMAMEAAASQSSKNNPAVADMLGGFDLMDNKQVPTSVCTGRTTEKLVQAI